MGIRHKLVTGATVDALKRTLARPQCALYAATHDYVTRVATFADERAPRPGDRPLATECPTVIGNRAEPSYTFSQTFKTDSQNVFGNYLTIRKLPQQSRGSNATMSAT